MVTRQLLDKGFGNRSRGCSSWVHEHQKERLPMCSRVLAALVYRHISETQASGVSI